MAPPGDLEEDGEKSSLQTLADSSRRAGQKIGYKMAPNVGPAVKRLWNSGYRLKKL